jgi:hypothetical protein
MRPKGRVLKVKTGYNPNSSSIGTEITVFLWGAAIFTLVANTLFALSATVMQKKNEKNVKK